MTFLRWNFSSRARELSGGDALIISIPKSGRTWVRTFLCAYFCGKTGQKFTLEPEHLGGAPSPRIIYSHDRFEQRTKADLWGRVRGKYLIPPAELRRAQIILLARDPRDAFVSLFVQLTRRTRETAAALKQKDVGEMLRDPAHGIASIIATMNAWWREFNALPGFQIVRYEALRADPAGQFRDLLATLGESAIDEAAFAHALGFSDFGHMKKMEAAGAFDSKILRPGDVADPESFKVRKGQVGGYREYLIGEDLELADREMRKLDLRFGYSPTGGRALDDPH